MSQLSSHSANALRILQSARAGPSKRPLQIATSRSLFPSSCSTCATLFNPFVRTYATSQISPNSATGSSTSTPTTSRSATTSIPRPRPHQHPAFDNLSTSLSSLQPCFGARGDEIELLTSPQQFYAKLLEMIKRAKKRILISSLYIGSEESELVDAIRLGLKNNPHLRVTFILDYHRATRLSKPTTTTTTTATDGSESQTQTIPPSTAHLLLPLVREFSDRCEVWLFRSPKLKGIMEKLVPARFDEGWGTWHGKWYGVDDEVVISGANLASSYFTNRQDRYIHFRSNPSLLSYLSSLTRLFTQYSYLLHHSPPAHIPSRHAVPLPSLSPSSSSVPEASLIWPGSSIHPRSFAAHALATLTAFQNSWRSSNSTRLRRVDVDTWFWPVIQAGVLGIKEEEKALAEVWRAVADSYVVGNDSNAGTDRMKGEKEKEQLVQAEQVQQEGERVEVDLTSGYFGLYKAYKKAVINSPAPVRIIAASPKANGFYGSKGMSKLIPEGYTLLESRFHQDTVKQGREWDTEKGSGVRLKEWEREGWTYHSKGLWLSPSRDIPKSNPFLTFIGSSNLSTRSLTLDTELSMILMTSSPVLRRALGNEVRALDQYTVDVGEKTWLQPERKVSWAAWILVALGVEGML